MKITAIRAYQVDLPLKEGRYAWSNENAVETFDSTVVAVETDAGITGHGECCPLGPAYLPAYAAGVRAGLEGAGAEAHRPRSDPSRRAEPAHGRGDARPPLREIGRRRRLLGHPGQGGGASGLCAAGRRAAGRREALPRDLAGHAGQDGDQRRQAYRAEGYTKFQLKVGGDADVDIERIRACREVLKPGDVLIADSNTGWTMHEAARVVQAVRDVDVYIEQPCRTYEECLTVRRRTSLPFILDENIDGIGILLRAIADGAMDVINLKISKVGGLTRAREMRDLCISAGVAMTIEDTWGGDIVTAAIAHLARSTPEEFLFSADRLQQLRHPQHRQGRPATQGRPDDRARPARPRPRAAAGGAGQAGAERGRLARLFDGMHEWDQLGASFDGSG